MLAHILGRTKEFLYTNPDFRLTQKQQNGLAKLIKGRRQGMPVAYLLSYKYFYGLKFKVTPDVLIPRPETEMLVDRTLEIFPKLTAVIFGNRRLKPIKILEVGTGSGCVTISIAANLRDRLTRKQLRLIASDQSKKALAVARQNAQIHKAQIKFVQSDLLSNPELKEVSFDLIIANLPYLNRKWITGSIKFEPKQALFASNNGLALIDKLLRQISIRKRKPKFILLEFDPRQKSSLSKLIKKYLHKARSKFYRDYAKRWRFVVIKP